MRLPCQCSWSSDHSDVLLCLCFALFGAQLPMLLMDLISPSSFKLLDQAFITGMSLCLGILVPHTCVPQHSTNYAHIDICAAFLLSDSSHTLCSLHTLHNGLAFCLYNLASSARLASSALQSDVPVSEEDTYSSGDIVTSNAGISSSSTYRFYSKTQLITCVTITVTWVQAEFY